VIGAAELHHIGATSLPFGSTKGDVDVNVRVDPERFDAVVEALGARLPEAQRQNWTPGFASFSAPGYELPLGVQVTAIGAKDDFLLALRDRMRDDPETLRRYDEVKRDAAPLGQEEYWRRKDVFLRDLLGTLEPWAAPARSR
jgi:GrpB-like predicted nucleotidyltransferase (UPF0157 family)